MGRALADANDGLHEELSARPAGAGEAGRGELDGLVAAVGGVAAADGGRVGVTLYDVKLARRLYRLLRARGRDARLFVGRRLRGQRPLQGSGAVFRVTWAYANDDAARSRRGLAYARGYVRGMTIGCGYLGDPARGYGLEWNLAAATGPGPGGAARRLAACLRRMGIAHGTAPGRRGGVRLYVKGGEAVGDLLAQMEAGDSMLGWENARALRAMRGRIHREVNGEAANLRRAARTGVRQAEAARALLARAGAALPPAIVEAARARLDQPQASLEELAAVLGLSKSGANQRMRRMMALWRERARCCGDGDDVRPGPGL